MTIKNSSLGERLNNAKNNVKPEETPKEQKNTSKSTIAELLSSVMVSLLIPLKSLIFGYSLKILLKQDWNILAILCIGFSISYIFQLIHDIFQKK